MVGIVGPSMGPESCGPYIYIVHTPHTTKNPTNGPIVRTEETGRGPCYVPMVRIFDSSYLGSRAV